MAEKAELVVAALQERIGQMASNYETQIAILRAEITQLIDEKKQREESIQKYSDTIDNKSN